MPSKKYRITLTETERAAARAAAGSSTQTKTIRTRAQALLMADEGRGGPGFIDEDIASALGCSVGTVERVRRKCSQEDVAATLERKKCARRPHKRKLDGRGEATLVATACSGAPEGAASWTLRLLADRMVELGVSDEISYETVRRTLKKNVLKPWLTKSWCIPPKANGEFVARMEQVLDIYHRPRDPEVPLICLDEVCKQLLGEKQDPLPPRPGIPGRQDFEYTRDGVASLFMVYAPLEGIRHTHVGPDGRRTARDYADCLRLIAEEWFPDARRITLVMDNLNTHKMGSLYERFPAAEARALASRFDVSHTPKHGSWLNMAECEISVLARQCLKRRIPDLDHLRSESSAWAARRNSAQAKTVWRFSSGDARLKLQSLYPSIEV